MTESRDLRGVFEEVCNNLSTADLDVVMMVVYDRQTESYEAIEGGSLMGATMVDFLRENIDELKKAVGMEASE